MSSGHPPAAPGGHAEHGQAPNTLAGRIWHGIGAIAREAVTLATLVTGGMMVSNGKDTSGKLVLGAGAIQGVGAVSARIGGRRGNQVTAVSDAVAGAAGGLGLGIAGAPYLGAAVTGAMGSLGTNRWFEGEPFDREHHLTDLRQRLTGLQTNILAAFANLERTMGEIRQDRRTFAGGSWPVDPSLADDLRNQINVLDTLVRPLVNHRNEFHNYLHHCHAPLLQAARNFTITGGYVGGARVMNNVLSQADALGSAWRGATFAQNHHEAQVQFPAEVRTRGQRNRNTAMQYIAPVALGISGVTLEMNHQIKSEDGIFHTAQSNESTTVREGVSVKYVKDGKEYFVVVKIPDDKTLDKDIFIWQREVGVAGKGTEISDQLKKNDRFGGHVVKLPSPTKTEESPKSWEFCIQTIREREADLANQADTKVWAKLDPPK